MSSRPIAYNLLRLILASIHTTPRGVDRIDYGYLSYLLDHWPEDVFGVMPTLIGPRYFSRGEVLKARARLDRLWSETIDPKQDPALERLIRRFDDPFLPELPAKPRGFLPGLGGIMRIGQLLLGDGYSSIGKPITALPQGSVYLDVGHYGLTFPRAFRWKSKRPDIKTVFMIHDAIPLEYPEFVAEETFRAHQRLIMKTAKYANSLIVPTRSAGKAVQEALAQHRGRPIGIHAIPLPIDDLFQPEMPSIPALANHPYFLICGAIEPRKNHRLLIAVWQELIRRYDTHAPKLVVAGSPGHASGEIIQELQASEELRRHIILTSGLSSPALAQLMAGARAILMPSFVEGFGLPPAEGLTVGTPTLLSDIPAHREAVGQFGEFLPTKNPDPWVEAIEALCDTTLFRARKASIRAFRPTRWTDYMAKVSEVLRDVGNDVSAAQS